MILEGGDATTVSSSVAKLHARFAECEELLKNLPGGDMSKEQQKQRIEELTAKIANQKALVNKYKNLDVLHRIAGQSQSAPTAQLPGLGEQSNSGAVSDVNFAGHSAPPSAGLTEQSAGDVDFSGQITPGSASGGLLGDEDLFFSAQK